MVPWCCFHAQRQWQTRACLSYRFEQRQKVSQSSLDGVTEINWCSTVGALLASRKLCVDRTTASQTDRGNANASQHRCRSIDRCHVPVVVNRTAARTEKFGAWAEVGDDLDRRVVLIGRGATGNSFDVRGRPSPLAK